MLDTGIGWEGPGDYDAVIDYTVILLISDYEDKTILPEVADLIFRRNRRGGYIQTWCGVLSEQSTGKKLWSLSPSGWIPPLPKTLPCSLLLTTAAVAIGEKKLP